MSWVVFRAAKNTNKLVINDNFGLKWEFGPKSVKNPMFSTKGKPTDMCVKLSYLAWHWHYNFMWNYSLVIFIYFFLIVNGLNLLEISQLKIK